MAQREGREVALQVVVAAHRAVFGDDEQLLVFGPAEALDGALVPLHRRQSGWCVLPSDARHRTLMLRISLPAQLYTSMLALATPGPL